MPRYSLEDVERKIYVLESFISADIYYHLKYKLLKGGGLWMLDYKGIMTDYASRKEGIIEAYHAVQKELNYLPKEAIKAAAEAFKIPEKEAYGVATFYSYFSVQPRGKYIIPFVSLSHCRCRRSGSPGAGTGIKMGDTTLTKPTLNLSHGPMSRNSVITVNGNPYGGVTGIWYLEFWLSTIIKVLGNEVQSVLGNS